MKYLNREKVAELLKAAAENPRRRTHFNFHENLEDPINRLCIAACPDTVVPPHRHSDKWELFMVFEGAMKIYTYHDDGTVKAEYLLDQSNHAVELPAMEWHNFVAMTPCIAFEVKPGPYRPLNPEETATFAGVKP